MAQTLGQLADTVRKIPIAEILAARGFTARREGVSTMFRNDGAHAINVTGNRWFDHKAQKGGVGTIDLVMHLDEIPFREAVLKLYNGDHAPLDAETFNARPQPERKCFSDLLATYGKRSDENWPTIRDYLVNRRKLPAKTVDALYVQGRLYANDKKSAVFVHHRSDGTMTGATIKSTNPYSQFQQCIGDKKTAWFLIGETVSEAREIVITEAPIDAISYHTLHGKPDQAIISVAGQCIHEEIFQIAREHNKKIIIGLDNPHLERTPAAAEITHAVISDTIANNPDLRIHVHHPTRKDWNDDLRAALKKLEQPTLRL